MAQQFVVPQFIDVEDKIFGPITTRQFLILLVAGIIIFIVFKLADTALFILLTLLIGGTALIFAFVKINGQTFHYFLLNIIESVRKPQLRAWKKSFTSEELDYLRKRGIVEVMKKEVPKARPTENRVRDLALIVNTGGFYRPDEE